MSRLRFRAGGGASPDPTPIPNPNPGGIEDLDPLRFKPIALTTTVYRTMLVDAGDEVIDLTREVLHPGSPQAVLFQVSGTHWDNWKQDTVGLLTAKTSIRNSLKATTQTLNIKALNGAGWSAEVVLTILVKADADCRFCDFASGADANNGTTPALAWKHAPRSYPFTGTQVTLGAGKVLFFKAGKHRYSLVETKNLNYTYLPHSGTTGNPFIFSGAGWGGRAQLAGDEVEVGTVSTVTQAEVGGNPNYASIRKIALGSAIEVYQRFFVGDKMFNPAQFPQPTNPRLFRGAQDPTSSKGLFTDIAFTTSSGVSPRAYQTGGAGGNITWVDARHAARYGNVASATVEGRKVQFWQAGNFVEIATIASYDYATSTLVVTPGAGGVLSDAGSGFTAIGTMFHPADIAGPEQYAVSADATVAYFWYEAGEISVSRLLLGVAVGSSYVRFQDFDVGRYAGGTSGTGGGAAFAKVNSATAYELDIVGSRIEHCSMLGEGGVITNASAGSWLDSNISRNYGGFSPYAGFFRNAVPFAASVGATLTKAQVAALTVGKISYNYIEPYAYQGTSYLFIKMQHIEFVGNVHRESLNSHGGGLKMYTDSVAVNGDYIYRNYIHDNAWVGIDRCMAFSGTPTDRSNWLERNVYLGDASASASYPVGRDPGCERSGEIMGFVPGGSYPYAYTQAAGDYADTFRGCVVAGMSRGTLASCKYDIQDCYFPDTSVLENDGADRIFANNEVETGVVEWDWLNDNMPTKWHDEIRDRDGAGPIGLYWEIAA